MVKKLFTFLLTSLLACSAFAQDIIVHKDGKVVVGKITEIDADHIRYKRADNPDGPTYTMPMQDILSIQYENGKTERFVNGKPEGQEPLLKKKEETASEEQSATSSTEEKKVRTSAGTLDSRPIINLDDDDDSSFDFQPEVHICIDGSNREKIEGGFSIEFIASFKVSPFLSVGPGIGTNTHRYYEGNTPLISEDEFSEKPIFIQMRTNLTKKPLSPYIIGQCGYTLGDCFSEYADEEHPNSEADIFFKIGAGTSFKFKHGYLFFDVNYRYQHIKKASFSSVGFWGASFGYAWSKN